MTPIADWVTSAAAVGTVLVTIWLAVIAREGFKLSNKTADDAVRLQRAKWTVQLSSQFFGEHFREVREALDNTQGHALALMEMIRKEDPRLTEFLNFFETVAILKKSGQIGDVELDAVFGYYLKLFPRHKELLEYIANKANSYENLAGLLRKL